MPANNQLPVKHKDFHTKQEGKDSNEKDNPASESTKHPVNDHNNNNVTRISNLKKLELPPINTCFDDYHTTISSKNFLEFPHCNTTGYDSCHPHQSLSLAHKDIHKNNNEAHGSYSKSQDVSCEKKVYSGDYLKESTKYPNEYSRTHLRYHSADVIKNPLRDPSKNPSMDYSKGHLRYHSAHALRHYRDHSVDIPREHLRNIPRELPREHLKNHSRDHSIPQIHSRQNLGHRNLHYPPPKPINGFGIEPEGNSKRSFNPIEKVKPNDNHNNSYDEYVPPRQSWKNYPFSRNGYTLSQDSTEGQSNSLSSYKTWVPDKQYENNVAQHDITSQNYTSHPSHPYYEDVDRRYPDNAECTNYSYQNYHNNNLPQTYESLSPRLKSPAISTSSHFTSISQRGINPNWIPSNKEKMHRMGKPRHNVADVALINNPNFDVFKNPRKNIGISGSNGISGMPKGIVSNT